MTTKQPGDLASTREKCHNESYHHQHQHGDPGRALHLPLRLLRRDDPIGFYETTLNGSPTGQYEAVVIGNDLTLP